MDPTRRKLVGAAVQQTRKLLGNSQVDVARVLGISSGMVSWIETGRAELSLDQIQQLATYWEMPLVTLVERLGYPLDRDAPRFDDWYRMAHSAASNNSVGTQTAKRGSARHSGSPAVPQVPLPEKWRYARAH